MEAIKAFIPAAGFGERLRPITDDIPKPLLPLLGRPVIETILERIDLLSPAAVAVNIHHCREQMVAWHEASPYSHKIALLHEDPILGTGGAIRNAADILQGSVFLVHNADILSNIDLAALVSHHMASGNIATLAVHDCPRYANVWVDGHGNLQHVGGKTPEHDILCKIAFMGIAVYSPDFLNFLPPGPSSVVRAWLNAAASGHTIGTLDFSGAEWTDIGTPNAYAAAVFDALKRQGESVYVHPSFDCSNAELLGNVVIEHGSSCREKAFLHNSIILPGTLISHGAHIEQKIIGRGFSLPLSPDEIFETVPVDSPLLASCGYPDGRVSAAIRIGTGGSDRTYHRIPAKGSSSVFMACRADDRDFERHLELTRFFSRHGIPVPAVIMADHKEKQAVLEDLGDLSLYSWLACRKPPERIEAMYRKVIDILVILHTTVTADAAGCPPLLERRFDREHLRWETGYFMEHYIRPSHDPAIIVPDLDAEFERLAQTVASLDAVVLHRDFQSQNIMVVGHDEPRVIDFQGARLGPAAYDIASVLWDPYHRLEDHMRQRLITFYVARRNEASPGFDENAFRNTLLPCRLQRHMQALGAYGFLSAAKGKKSFLRHIPQALTYLKQEAEEAGATYPALSRMVRGLK